MKAKKLNQALFGKMELNQADMKSVKGAEAETVYSGSGLSGDGRRVHEYCTVFDDGSFRHDFILASGNKF